MRHTKRLASLAFIAIAASLASAVPARASGMASYTIVQVTYTGSDATFSSTDPSVDNSGNLVGPNGRDRNTGIYQLGSVQNSEPGMQNITLSYYLHANGSDVNLLPTSMQNPSTGDAYQVNALGLVNGYVGLQPVVYSAVSGQFLVPQGLPGQFGPASLGLINNNGQAIGGQNGQSLFYSSPTAIPVPLTDLLPLNSGWKLLTVSDFNDLGEIVGSGVDPSGHLVDYEMIPTVTPEPSTLTILVLGVLVYGGWQFRSRTRQPRTQNEVVVI